MVSTKIQSRLTHLPQLIKEYDENIAFLTLKLNKKKNEFLQLWYEWHGLKNNCSLKNKFDDLTQLLKNYEKKIGLLDNEIRYLKNRKIKLENKLLSNKPQSLHFKTRTPLKNYYGGQYPIPETFANRYENKKCLIIAPGPSTQNLIKYKDKLREKFDVIIGINGTYLSFESIMDFHIIVDRLFPKHLYDFGWFKEGQYNKKLPRIVNWRSIHIYPDDLTLIKTNRNNFSNYCNFSTAVFINLRQYKHGKQEGLLRGPLNRQGLSVGTPVTQSIHFAGILGCSKVYLIGVELKFDKQYDHFNKDRFYRDNIYDTKFTSASPIIKITHDNELIETTEYFLDSAEYMNEVLIPKICKSVGLEVFDFSDGLLSKDIQINLDEFMDTK